MEKPLRLETPPMVDGDTDETRGDKFEVGNAVEVDGDATEVGNVFEG